MNDFAYAATLSRELLQVASTLFATHDLNDLLAERSVLLEMDEMSEALNHPKLEKQ